MRVLPELARRGCRGIAFDFPGLGLAERPAEFDYSWSGLAAHASPNRVRSLTVLNTLVRAASFKRPWSMEPFARRGIGEIYLRTLRPFAFERLMRMQGVGREVPADEVRAYVPLLKRGDGGRAFLQIVRGFERTEAFERRITAALSSREFPAQVLWGENDPALLVEHHGEQVREVLGVDAVVRLRGKHFVQEDSPAEIAEHVARLVSAGRAAWLA